MDWSESLNTLDLEFESPIIEKLTDTFNISSKKEFRERHNFQPFHKVFDKCEVFLMKKLSTFPIVKK